MSLTRADKERLERRIMKKSGWRCWYCGTQLKKRPSINYNYDHFIPKANGGTNAIRNLVPSCKSCNDKKADLSIDEFRLLMTLLRESGNKYIEFNAQQIKHMVESGCRGPVEGQYIFYFEERGLRL